MEGGLITCTHPEKAEATRLKGTIRGYEMAISIYERPKNLDGIWNPPIVFPGQHSKEEHRVLAQESKRYASLPRPLPEGAMGAMEEPGPIALCCSKWGSTASAERLPMSRKPDYSL